MKIKILNQTKPPCINHTTQTSLFIMFHKSWVFTVLLVAIATSSNVLSPFSKALETLKSSNGVKSYLKSEEEHCLCFWIGVSV